MIYCRSQLVEDDYGVENVVEFMNTDWVVVYRMREPMSTATAISYFRRAYAWHGDVRVLQYVGRVLN